MEYRDWLDFAEKKGLLISGDDMEKLKVGKPYDVIRVDYFWFIAMEGAKKYGIKYDHIYDPVKIMSRFKQTIVPTGHNYTKKEYAIVDCCHADIAEVQHYDVVEVQYPEYDNPEYKIIDNTIYKIKNENIVGSGWSGDGYSRYMFFDNVKKMPKFYIKKPDYDQDE
jgi:hypothetical protein